MAIGSLVFGYANAVIAIVAAQPSFLLGLMNSLYFAGGFCGCAEAGLVATYASSPEVLANLNESALQAAVAMCYDIGWKFYLCFICPSTVAAVLIYFVLPDTRGLPLESVGALCGNEVGEAEVTQDHMGSDNEKPQKHDDDLNGYKEQVEAAVTTKHVEGLS
ncbi:uncharacterized protein A1O9_01873 [Exophiala aquamarina CBS 119918]|uniref:Major facilitator superfamily (MFS) profile domain-containing protein n=1 Tax=Exophiala aquamarina CBS 119918 TaxID=1182545 RepID=A0A072PLX4_9EURO|nr:uncharacterized protein A1O9_01873 [Exophiala aquamarina CBS 119918]KEF60313.1 hypothetical protein A1O9_01873 [Exophiala aquamarina CBS 119918]